MRRYFPAGLVLAGAAAALLAGTAAAHHGWGSYDPSKVVTLEGPVLESRYEFPHGEIVMEGQGKRWNVVLAPPSRLALRGVERDDIAVGKRLKAEGYPSKVVDNEMRAERLTIAGRVFEMR
jgi:Family of unknown function (DUF6152)